MFWPQIFDLVVGAGIILLQFGIVVVIALHFFKKDTAIYRWVQSHNIMLAFLLSLAALVGSLFYSEVLGLQPCLFCWWQRICTYPLAVILGIALWKNEGAVIKKYAITLATVGSLFAFYHYLIEKFSVIAATVDCTAVGTVSCAESPVSVFGGYITIPMMSLTILIATILLLSMKKKS